MKKAFTLFLAAFLILAACDAKAQSFDGGFLAGAVTSQIDGDGYGGFHQLGWTGGVFGRIPTNGPVSWQMELRYTLLGSHSDAKEVEMGMAPINIRLHYAELPLLLRYDLSGININGIPLTFITLEAGVSLDVLIYGAQSAYLEDLFPNSSWLFFTSTGHLGVDIKPNERWSFNLRTMASLIPCRWRSDSPSLFYGHYYNIAIAAGVTYTLIHKGE